MLPHKENALPSFSPFAWFPLPAPSFPLTVQNLSPSGGEKRSIFTSVSFFIVDIIFFSTAAKSPSTGKNRLRGARIDDKTYFKRITRALI